MTRSTLSHPNDFELGPDELAALRSMLEQQRAFRVEQLLALAQPGPHGPLGSAAGEVHASLSRGARRALHEVQRALWRMDEGRYGHCTACGGGIGRERLEILPQIELCLPCQRAAVG